MVWLPGPELSFENIGVRITLRIPHLLVLQNRQYNHSISLHQLESLRVYRNRYLQRHNQRMSGIRKIQVYPSTSVVSYRMKKNSALETSVPYS